MKEGKYAITCVINFHRLIFRSVLRHWLFTEYVVPLFVGYGHFISNRCDSYRESV